MKVDGNFEKIEKKKKKKKTPQNIESMFGT